MFMLEKVIFFFFIILTTFQTSIYLDCENGNDGNDGKTITRSIQTIARLSTMLDNNFNASAVFLKANCIYKDKLRISGAENLEITSYGEGTLPTIDISKAANQWVNHGNGIYYSTINELHQISSVFLNGKRLKMPCFPENENSLENFFYTPTNSTNRTIIPLPDKFLDKGLSREQVVGSLIHVKYSQSNIHGTKVVDYDDQKRTIELEEKIPTISEEGIKEECGFILSNQFWMMENCTKCFFHDQSANRLYIKIGNNPNYHKIEYITTENTHGIEIMDSNKITIKNLISRKNTKAGIYLFANASHVTIHNCQFDNNGFGINTDQGIENLIFKTNTITNSMEMGILIHTKDNTTISDNFVSDSTSNFGFLEFMTSSISLGNGIAIISNEASKLGINHIIVERNQIQNSGFNGMYLEGFGVQINKNLINCSCLLFAECAGIQVSGGSNHVVADNLLMNSIGNTLGTPEKENEGVANGISFSKGANNILAQKNAIINAYYNIKLHNSPHNTIKENVVIDARVSSFHISEDEMTGTPLENIWNNTVEGNIFYSEIENTRGITLFGGLDFIDMFTNLNGNYYFREIFNLGSSSESPITINSLLDWQIETKERNLDWDIDSHQIYPNYEFVQYSFTPFNNSFNLIANGDFNNSIDGFSSYATNATIKTTWDEMKAIKTEIEAVDKDDIVLFISPNFPIEKSTHYIAEFEIWVNHTSFIEYTSCVVAVKDTTTNIALFEEFKVSSKRKKFQFEFGGKFSSEDTRFEVQWLSKDKNITFFMSNLEIFEVNTTYYNEKDSYSYVFNPNIYEKMKVSLDIPVCDHKGRILKSITLSPLEASVLVNCFDNKDGKCNNHENANTCSDCEPICGNFVCEEGENILTCPMDCISDRETKAVIITSIVTVILVIVVIALVILVVILDCLKMDEKKKKKKNVEMKE